MFGLRLPSLPRPPSLEKFPPKDRKVVVLAAIASGTTIATTAILCGHVLAGWLGWLLAEHLRGIAP